ncbi:MAG: chemotaxis protein CheB [Victivallales bacterium]|jgi:two-component system chemotaxis response regulator CheB
MKQNYRAIVIGASAGGLGALKTILSLLKENISVPVIIVQHTSPNSGDYMVRHLDSLSKLRVKEADEKEKLEPGTAYVAPANYHLLVESDETLSLSVDERVNYSRPSIDVLFESASDVFGDALIGIVLTGANSDGSAGLRKIKDSGGLAVVQEPRTAEVPAMPQSAIDAVGKPVHVLSLEGIAELLNRIC